MYHRQICMIWPKVLMKPVHNCAGRTQLKNLFRPGDPFCLDGLWLRVFPDILAALSFKHKQTTLLTMTLPHYSYSWAEIHSHIDSLWVYPTGEGQATNKSVAPNEIFTASDLNLPRQHVHVNTTKRLKSEAMNINIMHMYSDLFWSKTWCFSS